MYICENGCKWRRLPKEYGKRHVIYKRFRYWLEKGYIERLFVELCVQSISQAEILAFLSDSMTVPVHPDACGALKKRGEQATGRSRGWPNNKIHMIATGLKHAVSFLLSSGNCHDAPQGRILMDVDDYTRYIAQTLGFIPVVHPKSNRKNPWEYDKELYKLRNEIERLFRLLQGFRRVFCRFDKLDYVYIGFIQIALIFIAIR